MTKRNILTMLKPIQLSAQKLAVGAAAASSLALPNDIEAVRLYATQNMWIEVDGKVANGTGTVSGSNTSGLSMFLPAGIVEYIACTPSDGTGSGVTISAIQDTTAGVLHICPMSV